MSSYILLNIIQIIAGTCSNVHLRKYIYKHLRQKFDTLTTRRLIINWMGAPGSTLSRFLFFYDDKKRILCSNNCTICDNMRCGYLVIFRFTSWGFLTTALCLCHFDGWFRELGSVDMCTVKQIALLWNELTNMFAVFCKTVLTSLAHVSFIQNLRASCQVFCQISLTCKAVRHISRTPR